MFICLLDLWFRSRFLCAFYMFGSVRFRFGKQNFNWLFLFGSGRTVKHCFGRSLPWIINLFQRIWPYCDETGLFWLHHSWGLIFSTLEIGLNSLCKKYSLCFLLKRCIYLDSAHTIIFASVKPSFKWAWLKSKFYGGLHIAWILI